MIALAFLGGALTGALGLLFVLSHWAAGAASQRYLARYRAEQRLRDVQNAAMSQMAAVAEQAVYDATRMRTTSGWPSDGVATTRAIAVRSDDGGEQR